MNRSYDHIKYFVHNIEVEKRIKHWPGGILPTWLHDPKHHANQLDDKQRHTRFDYYEYDIPKIGTPSWAQTSLDRSTSNQLERLEDPERDQTRHQAIHDHGRGVTCYIQWGRRGPGNRWYYPGS